MKMIIIQLDQQLIGTIASFDIEELRDAFQDSFVNIPSMSRLRLFSDDIDYRHSPIFNSKKEEDDSHGQ